VRESLVQSIDNDPFCRMSRTKFFISCFLALRVLCKFLALQIEELIDFIDNVILHLPQLDFILFVEGGFQFLILLPSRSAAFGRLLRSLIPIAFHIRLFDFPNVVSVRQ
jgi:hypothetical protein